MNERLVEIQDQRFQFLLVREFHTVQMLLPLHILCLSWQLKHATVDTTATVIDTVDIVIDIVDTATAETTTADTTTITATGDTAAGGLFHPHEAAQ